MREVFGMHNIALLSDKYQQNTFLEDVVSTSGEKKAPLYMERLQKEHLINIFGLDTIQFAVPIKWYWGNISPVNM